jgi:hypothetical protein
MEGELYEHKLSINKSLKSKSKYDTFDSALGLYAFEYPYHLVIFGVAIF